MTISVIYSLFNRFFTCYNNACSYVIRLTVFSILNIITDKNTFTIIGGIIMEWTRESRYKKYSEWDAETLLNEVVKETLDEKDRYFDNARWIKKFFTSGVFPAMAMRVMKEKRLQIGATCLQCIRKEDIAYAAARFRKQKSPVLVPRRRIGFIA